MKIHVGIPARMAASRFPGKPLAKILGRTMIDHVVSRTKLAKNVDNLFVATCDNEIVDEVKKLGIQSILTDKNILRPGLRVASALNQFLTEDDDIVIVVQGDEPLVHPSMIETAIKELKAQKTFQVGTLYGKSSEEEFNDPNEVKVVLGNNNQILYMSRSPIPFQMVNQKNNRFKQVAIIPFRMSYLKKFEKITPRFAELTEAIELLRVIENGDKLLGIYTDKKNVSVDTIEGLAEAEIAMKYDELYGSY